MWLASVPRREWIISAMRVCWRVEESPACFLGREISRRRTRRTNGSTCARWKERRSCWRDFCNCFHSHESLHVFSTEWLDDGGVVRGRRVYVVGTCRDAEARGPPAAGADHGLAEPFHP